MTATEVGQGIRDVLAGRLGQYEHDYPCHSPVQDRWFTAHVTPAVIAGARSALVTHRDVTTLHNLRRSLAYESLHDSLTGLPNRHLLHDRLTDALADSSSRNVGVAVAVVSLDRLRQINQSGGRAAGDGLIVDATARLRRLLNAGDTLARGSDGEFVVVGVDISGANEAVELCGRLLTAVQEPYDIGTTRFTVTASIGVAFGRSPQRGEDLLQAADAALGEAKRYGAGRVRLFTEELRTVGQRPGERLQPATAVTSAPATTGAPLALEYQPIVDLHEGGLVVAVEAIASGGLGDHTIPDGTGSHAALSSTTAGPLMSWALNTACHEIAGLPVSNDQPVAVAVSLPWGYLTQLDVTTRVAEALAHSQLEPARLILQVPEATLLQDQDNASVSLQALAALGVRIAINGFGTASFTLVQLSRYPISFIKLDRAFVAGIGVGPNEEAFCSSLISLADAIGAAAVAEGVETAEQHSVLHAFGCGRGQGSLWSPAVALANLPGAIQTCSSVPVPAPTRRRRAAMREQPEVAARIATLRVSGASLRTIAAALNRDETVNPTGMRWTAGDVARHITS